MTEYEQISKERMIKQEINRIKKLYKEFPKDKIKVIEGVIIEAAFMKITLEELREDLSETGEFEDYENGSQLIRREKPESKKYDSRVKIYANVMKQLIDLLPDEEKKENEDELMTFIKKGKV